MPLIVGRTQWHRVFTETLQRLHLTKPQCPTQHVTTEDDCWLAELDQTFSDLEDRVAIRSSKMTKVKSCTTAVSILLPIFKGKQEIGVALNNRSIC